MIPRRNSFFPVLTQVGNNIKGDVKKLRKDFPEGDVVNYAELTSLTSRPTAQRRLADLVTMASGKYLDKDVAGGALADWTQDSFSAAELKYATSDAYASLFVWEELERRKAGLLPSVDAEQPTHEGVGGETTDARPEGPGSSESSEMPVESEDGEAQRGGGSRSLWNLPEDVREDMAAGGSMEPVSNEEGADEELPEHDVEDVHDEMPPEVRPTCEPFRCVCAVLILTCQLHMFLR